MAGVRQFVQEKFIRIIFGLLLHSTTPMVASPAMAEDIVAIGRAYAEKTTTVLAQVEGHVVELHADLGDRLENEALIAKIDDWSYSIDLARAQANATLADAQHKEAHAQYERAEALYAKKAGSAQARESAETKLSVAAAELNIRRAELARAERNLSDTSVTAPFAGHIAERQTEIGDFVRKGDPVVTLTDFSSIRVRFDLIERDYAKLAIGVVGQIVFEALPNQSFRGQIKRMGPSARGTTDTFPIEVSLANDSLEIKPGYTARITFASDEVAVR